MKVLIIATSRFEISGITNCIMNYYRCIDHTTIQMDFVVPNEIPEHLKKEIEEGNSKLYYIPMKIRKKNPVRYIYKLKNIIKEGQYDIIHAHGSSAILFLEMYSAKLAGCKIRIAHSHNTVTEHAILDKMLRPLFNRVYTTAFACGQEAGEWLFKDKPFHIIKNGIDLEKYVYHSEIRKKVREQYELEGNKVVGHVGSFNSQKNHVFLIEIFSELKKQEEHLKLVLVGDGPLIQEIKEKVHQLRLDNDVIFVGKTNKVEDLLQAMDMIAFPSLFEGFPLALVEFQVAGLPCLIADTITKDVKLTKLVEFMSLNKTSLEWADKIKNIPIADRNNTEYQKQIQQQGYNIRENAKNLEKIYEELYDRYIG